jgi:uncharacterized protein
LNFRKIFQVKLPHFLPDQNQETSPNCDENHCSTSFASILALAEKGDAEAQNKAGEMLHFGINTPQDFKGALTWYLKASAQSHPIAPNHIARLYLNGEGVSRDPKEAAKWYLLSAERGYAIAMYNVSKTYESGTGVTQDLKKAQEWLVKAEKTQPGIVKLIESKN